MAPVKKRITEQEAAALYVRVVIARAEKMWPTVYMALQVMPDVEFRVDDERKAALDLALAVMGQDLVGVRFFFPNEQAERITAWILHHADSLGEGPYAREEIKAYDEAYKQGSTHIEEDEKLLHPVARRLIHRWLAKGFVNLEGLPQDKKRFLIDTAMPIVVTVSLKHLVGGWKGLKDTFDLVDGTFSSA